MAALRLALVGGPMYDGLYEHLPRLWPHEVEVVVHADHPTLNRSVASLLAAGERIDVLATHSKYAPSQQGWLLALNGMVDLEGLAPAAVNLCRFGDALLCVPRNVDVRVLWARRDLVDEVPATWDDLLASHHAFAFPGRESGLFGTYFEVVTSLGGTLFDADLRPHLTSPESVLAIAALCALGERLPAAQREWHYDEVDAALVAGEVPLAAAWPGGTAMLRSSPTGDLLRPYPYFGKRSYAGCHAWAIPRTCADVPAALALVSVLSSFDAHRADAASGTVPAREDAFAAVEPADVVDERRLAILRETIATGMLTYPPLARFPAIEDAGWLALHRALRGLLGVPDAARAMQVAALDALRP